MEISYLLIEGFEHLLAGGLDGAHEEAGRPLRGEGRPRSGRPPIAESSVLMESVARGEERSLADMKHRGRQGHGAAVWSARFNWSHTRKPGFLQWHRFQPPAADDFCARTNPWITRGQPCPLKLEIISASQLPILIRRAC